MANKNAKTWNEFTQPWRAKLTAAWANDIMGKTSSSEEVVSILLALAKYIQNKSELSILDPLHLASRQREGTTDEQADQLQQLLLELGKLRAEHASHHSQEHQPRIPVAKLDMAMARSGLRREQLQKQQYTVGKTSWKRARDSSADAELEAGRAKVGRPTKVADPTVVAKVGSLLEQYLNDSSKIVVLRIHGKRQLVCARLLSKKLWRVYKEQVEIRSMLSWSSFHKLVKVQFPNIRPPGRRTDVCSHCKIFRKHIVPRAVKEYNRRRKAITDIMPTYWESFEAEQDIVLFRQHNQVQHEVLQAYKYVRRKNATARDDAVRLEMRLGHQLSLHEKEAKLLHKLKGHCELIEAYNWHKLSADRQADFTKKLLDELGPEEAYFHFDFKENVRYPMSKEETGDEWHAQNKLSLTVFGCVVYTPGRKNFNFLLVSEVLDHDSQIARLLLSRVLDVVGARPSYEWGKVKRLHLVCDCGPHFRSRESYAFFLHDLPRMKEIDVTWHEMARKENSK